MRFARIVFIAAGVWGIVVLTPLYFLRDVTGRQYAPPATYPQFFYGFLSVTMAWQIAFLVIASNPARLRLLMIPSIVEKLGHVVTVIVLHGQARISAADAMAAGPDLLLGILFIAAFAKTTTSDITPSETHRQDHARTPTHVRTLQHAPAADSADRSREALMQANAGRPRGEDE